MAIVLTRVRPPQRRKDIFRRPRLIDAIHQNIHRKVTFISAPAGFGKTALLVDFASDLEAVVCWYHISAADEDLPRFVQYLIAAFRQRFAGFGIQVEDWLNQSGSIDPEAAAVELINAIVQEIDDFTVLHLDDFHLVGESQSIADFMEVFLENLPDQLRLVIASRSVYGVPTARLFVLNDIATIDTDQLRFTAKELQDLVQQNYQITLQVTQAEELARRTDGWIIALLLAVRALEQGDAPRFDGAMDQVYSYLVEEVIQRQPVKLQEFMVQTAIVDEFSVPMIKALLEIPNAGSLIREMEERNLFVLRVETPQGLSYRYHQLFLEFLRERLVEKFPQRKQQLHLRAGRWFYGEGSIELAVYHMVEAGELKQAAQWMEEVSEHYFVTGRSQTITRWVKMLEGRDEYYQYTPRLLLSYAKYLIDRGQYQEGAALLDHAEPVLRGQAEHIQLANILVSRGIIEHALGQFQQAQALGEEAQSFLDPDSGDRNQWYRWLQAERIIGYSKAFLGKTDEAIAHLSCAVEGLRELSELAGSGEWANSYLHDLAVSLNDLGITYFNSGQILDVQRCFQEVLSIRKKMRSNRNALATALNNVGYIFFTTGQYRQAKEAYDEALLTMQQNRLNRTVISINNGLGDLFAQIDEYSLANDAYQQAIEIGEEMDNRRGLSSTYTGLAKLALYQGRFTEAQQLFREAAQLNGLGIDSPGYQLCLGRTYLYMGQWDLAIEALRNVVPSPDDASQGSQEKALGAFFLARAYHLQKDETLALAYLRLALKWAARLGYDQFLVVEGRRAKHLLIYAVAVEPENAQLRSLVERAANFRAGIEQVVQPESGLGGVPTEAAETTEPEIHLELIGFGSIQVKVNGESIPRSAWRARHARALLFYLMEHRGVEGDKIKLDFWPEFSQGKASSNFQSTLWRTRNALGKKDLIIFSEGGYDFAQNVRIAYDVDQFTEHLRQAAVPELSASERVSHWRAAVELATGPYLEEIDQEWVNDKRIQLNRQLVGVLTQWGEWSANEGRFDEAIEKFRRILGLEPYEDDIHLQLMKCLVQSGDKIRAREHFENYKIELRKTIGVAPSAALQTYYDELT